MTDKILVLNGHSYASAIEGIGDITTNPHEFMSDPSRFKAVLFTGGADISPEYYDDTSPDGICYNNPQRDIQEMAIADVALSAGVLMTGICRGSQLINVFAGGKMMHHIGGHAGGQHEMTLSSGEIITVNTLHHQMVIPPKGLSIIVGWSTEKRSQTYIGKDDKEVAYDGPEVEAVVYPAIKGVGVQYHPEMMDQNSAGYKYFHDMVTHALSVPWEDFVASYQEKDNEELYKCNHTAGG